LLAFGTKQLPNNSTKKWRDIKIVAKDVADIFCSNYRYSNCEQQIIETLQR